MICQSLAPWLGQGGRHARSSVHLRAERVHQQYCYELHANEPSRLSVCSFLGLLTQYIFLYPPPYGFGIINYSIPRFATPGPLTQKKIRREQRLSPRNSSFHNTQRRNFSVGRIDLKRRDLKLQKSQHCEQCRGVRYFYLH